MNDRREVRRSPWRHARTGTAVALLLAGIGSALAAQDPADVPGYETRTSPGQVSLDVTPRWEDGSLIFEIAANTHSVDLGGVDLMGTVRLLRGDTPVEPSSAGSLTGHHARAEVVFRLDERPERFALEIRDIPDVPVRTLHWPEPEAPADPSR